MIDVPGLPRFEIAPHHCFACGTLNTHGLHLDLHVERGRSWVELTYEERQKIFSTNAAKLYNIDVS